MLFRFSASITFAFIYASTAQAEWQVKDLTDPITGKREVEAALRTEVGAIRFFCSPTDNRRILIVEPTRFLGNPVSSYEWRDIWFRFDQRPAIQTRWKYAGNYASSPSDRTLIEFMSNAFIASEVKVRLIRYDRTEVDLTFDLTGTREAVGRAITLCGA